jgi:hypothetical protein
MGEGISTSPNTEVLQTRINKSNTLLQKREDKKKVYCSMISRVLKFEKHQEFDLALLPDCTIFCILEFLAGEIPSLLSVSALWHFRITEVMDHAFNLIESQFALIHSHLFIFKTSFQSSHKISITGKEGYRIDRVMIIEPLPILAYHTIKLRYLYRMFRLSQTYKAEFKLDCVKKGKRIVWSHKDNSREQGNDTRAYSQQIPSVCVGDEVEFAINWFSLAGLIKIDSIKWQPPLIQDTRAISRVLNTVPEEIPRNDYDPNQKKAHIYKISRVCELEISETEWYDSKYYNPPPRAARFDSFQPFLKLIKFEYAGADVILSKHTFKAETVGIVPESKKIFGVEVEVKDFGIRQEVKRMGLLYDRHRPIHLKSGDILIIYVSS